MTTSFHVTGEAIDIARAVLVDPNGNGDFVSIAEAVAYLNSLPDHCGIVFLEGGVNHSVASVVDARGVTFIGLSPVPTVIAVDGGVLQVGGTTFKHLDIQVPVTFTTNTYLLDLVDANGYVEYSEVDLQPATGREILGSSGALAGDIYYNDCGQSDQNGLAVEQTTIFTNTVKNSSGAGIIQFGNRPITVDSAGRADTTGQITGIPPRVLYVGVGENIQSRINSLVAVGGGQVIILAGTHQVTQPLTVLGNDVLIEGLGCESVIQAIAPWGGSGLTYDAVIQIGGEAGVAPVNGCCVRKILVEVQVTDVHGIVVGGGSDNKTDLVNVVSTTAPMVTYRTGIIFTDSVGAVGERFMCVDCIVTSDSLANRWGDGIHMDGNSYAGTYTGVYGFGNGVRDSIIRGCVVKYIFQTCYLLSACTDCAIFVNRASEVCQDVNGIGLGMLGCTNCQLVATTIVGAIAGSPFAPAIYKDLCTGCQVTNNIVDGRGTGGAGRRWLLGIWCVSGGLGVQTFNIINSNDLRYCTNGISISNASAINNYIGPNTFSSTVTTPYATIAIANWFQGGHRQGTGNPNGAVTGNAGDTFFDTATSTMYKCTSWPRGTVWQVI